jgi:prophage antirepressor-like protein
VRVQIDDLGLPWFNAKDASKALARQRHQIPVGQLFDDRLEETRTHHLKRRAIVIQHRHGLLSCLTQHLGRVFLERGHANRKIGIDRIHEKLLTSN